MSVLAIIELMHLQERDKGNILGLKSLEIPLLGRYVQFPFQIFLKYDENCIVFKVDQH